MVYFTEYSMCTRKNIYFLLLGEILYKCRLDPGGLPCCQFFHTVHFFSSNSVNYCKKSVEVSINMVDLSLLSIKSIFAKLVQRLC